MTFRLLLAVAGIAILVAPVSADAGAISRGARAGADYGNKAAGPVGGAVGSVMGGAAYGFRAGASKVTGIPEETGTVRRHRTVKHKRVENR
jgi:hypothetical protein